MGAAGTGLLGQYFQDAAFQEYVGSQVDPGVDFTWGTGVSPFSGVRDSTFGVRWSGQVEAPCTDTFTFTTISDDGVRLWVNGVLVIDDWNDHSNLTDTASVALTAGVPVSIQMDFFDSYGNARANLSWSAPGCVPVTTVIPASALFPAALSSPTPTLSPTVLPSWACPVPDTLSGSFGGQWASKDVGSVVAGSHSIGSSLQVSADGRGIQTGPVFGEASSGDAFHFIYQPVWGDFDVILQIHSVPSTAGGQAGLMLREDNNEGSQQAYVGASQTGVFQQSARLSTGVGNAGALSGAFSNGSWVRLQRNGTNVTTSYGGAPAGPWTAIGPALNFSSLNTALLVGIAVSSDVAGTLGQAQVSDFQVRSAGCQSATPTITATFTMTPTWTFSPTASDTPTITPTWSESPTFSHSPTFSPTPTTTATPTASPSSTETPSATPSPTITPTWSESPTFSVSPTITPSPTISPTWTPGPGRPLSHLLAYPNPFSDRLSLGYTVGSASQLELVVYNVAGEEVFRRSFQASAGTHIATWDGLNTAGTRSASGVYLVRIKADGEGGFETQWATVALIR